jgi:hypothetical protein
MVYILSIGRRRIFRDGSSQVDSRVARPRPMDIVSSRVHQHLSVSNNSIHLAESVRTIEFALPERWRVCLRGRQLAGSEQYIKTYNTQP